MSKRLIRKAIAVIGEGPTEHSYVSKLKEKYRYRFILRPELPRHSNYKEIFKRAKSLISDGVDIAFCLIDLDVIVQTRSFEAFERTCNSLPRTIVPIVTNCCTEFWFLLHFAQTAESRVFESCDNLITTKLREYLPGYEKTNKYFRRNSCFATLLSDENQARAHRNAELLLRKLYEINDPTQCSFSEISLLLKQLDVCKTCDFLETCDTCSNRISSWFSR